jgi:plastocyanin
MMKPTFHTQISRLFLLLVLLGSGRSVNATIVNITVGGASNTFSPSSTTITLGDTIRWQWAGGSHTTTSLGIPASAAAWNQPMNSASTTFSYKPTQLGVYNYQCNPHAPAMAGTFTVSAPTPVKMGNVAGKIDANGKAVLSWTTYTEENNRHFEVQKSGDGFSFSKIDIVASQAPKGNSTAALKYTYTDNTPVKERAFYRLYQQDIDGKGGYSNVVFLAVKGENDLQIHLHPNPVKDKLNIHIAGKIGKNATIDLIDITGKVLQTKVPDQDNTMMTVFDLSKMQAGSYLIQYKDDNQDITKKVTKE